jgi:hypothetical protein
MITQFHTLLYIIYAAEKGSLTNAKPILCESLVTTVWCILRLRMEEKSSEIWRVTVVY